MECFCTEGMQSPMESAAAAAAAAAGMGGYNMSSHHHRSPLLAGHPSHAAAAMMMAHPSMGGHGLGGPTSPYDTGLGHNMDIHAN